MSNASPSIRLGITPTCWTNDDFPLIGDHITFEQTLSEIALAGYEGCSIGHKFPTSIRDLGTALELRDLSITEPWVSTFFTVPDGADRTFRDFQERIDFLTRLNRFPDAGEPRVPCTTIGVAEFGNSVHLQSLSLKNNKPVLNDAQFKQLAEGLNALGEMAHRSGFELAYHPHMGTGIQTQDDLIRLMESTNPTFVHLLLDTGHLTWAGGNPLDIINGPHGNRIRHVHLKNLRRSVLANSSLDNASFEEYVRAGIFTVPGDPAGTIDFTPIVNALKALPYNGWMVVEAEQEFRRDGLQPLYYAKLARQYLKKLGIGPDLPRREWGGTASTGGPRTSGGGAGQPNGVPPQPDGGNGQSSGQPGEAGRPEVVPRQPAGESDRSKDGSGSSTTPPATGKSRRPGP
jgi:inosose dehydratase